jgi:hypothetical protein
MTINVHNRIVRTEGNIYRLIAATVGGNLLVSAECTLGPEKGQSILQLNNARSPRANNIRNLIRMGLIS